MRIVSLPGALMALTLMVPVASAAEDTDIELLRAAIDELRADYDARIMELERRLAIAEQNAAQASYAARSPAPSQAQSSGQAAFNPAIGVVFQGILWGVDGPGADSEGFAVGETELILNANVDDKFAAYLTAALAFEDGESELEIEEAWVETTALPAGFGARFGRISSAFGYLNAKHSHQWDFADLPLPYQAFFDGRYLDNGVRLTWLAPTNTYMELGGEILQGEGDPSGLAASTLFANVGGDLGPGGSWLAGASYLERDNMASLTGAHLVWKWSPDGNWKDRNFIFQTEYFDSGDDGVDGGWYAQAVYQPFERWRFGARADGLQTDADDPRRYSVMFDWSNSEFSRLRMQFTQDRTGTENRNEWGLQYIHSIGAHGAHSF